MLMKNDFVNRLQISSVCLNMSYRVVLLSPPIQLASPFNMDGAGGGLGSVNISGVVWLFMLG